MNKQLILAVLILLFFGVSCKSVREANRIEQEVIENSNSEHAKIRLSRTEMTVSSRNTGNSLISFVDAYKKSTQESCSLFDIKSLSKMVSTNNISSNYIKSYVGTKRKTTVITLASIAGFIAGWVLVSEGGIANMGDSRATYNKGMVCSGMALIPVSLATFGLKIPYKKMNKKKLFLAVDAYNRNP